MKLEFREMDEVRIPEFKGGTGDFIARMHTDANGKILYGKLEQGSSIGYHTHDTSSEIIYILEGNARCLYDDGEENLVAGDCHYCPKGHGHSLINAGTEPLVFFAVVPEQ